MIPLFLSRIITQYKHQKRTKYTSLNEIKISQQAILHNWDILQSVQPKSTLIPVVKSNAYGHGIEPICRILEAKKPKLIAVDSFPEYQRVRQWSSSEILILSQLSKDQYMRIDYPSTHIAVTSLETLKFLHTTTLPARIHLFINTGMNREGINQEDLKEVLSLIKTSCLRVEGLMSHMACADEVHALNAIQEKNFEEVYRIFLQNNIYPPYVHLGASAGIFLLHSPLYTAFRCGIALYGYNPLAHNHIGYQAAQNLRPALRVESTVVRTQTVKAGENISYSNKYITTQTQDIALIPFGYQEGLPRSLSSKGSMRYANNEHPILGNICMNLTVIDGTNLSVNDTVTVISQHPQHNNSIENIARTTGTIPYEILVRLDSSIRRSIDINKE